MGKIKIHKRSKQSLFKEMMLNSLFGEDFDLDVIQYDNYKLNMNDINYILDKLVDKLDFSYNYQIYVEEKIFNDPDVAKHFVHPDYCIYLSPNDFLIKELNTVDTKAYRIINNYKEAPIEYQGTDRMISIGIGGYGYLLVERV